MRNLNSQLRINYPPNSELPSPLVFLNGKTVATPDEWRDQRRPELKNLFQYYMYGNLPGAPDKVTAKVERLDTHYFGGKATKKELLLTFGPEGTPPIHLFLVIPNTPKQPAPVVLGLNFGGNYTIIKRSDNARPNQLGQRQADSGSQRQ